MGVLGVEPDGFVQVFYGSLKLTKAMIRSTPISKGPGFRRVESYCFIQVLEGPFRLTQDQVGGTPVGVDVSIPWSQADGLTEVLDRWLV